MTLPRVLLVDDDDLYREVLGERLRADGLAILEAPDLASARAQIDRRLSVVVLDQQLPDGHGLTLAQALRDRGSRARIIIVTGHPEVDDAVTALRLRIDDYLAKPIDLETVRLAVLRSLETLRLEDVDRLVRREKAQAGGSTLIGGSLDEARRLVTIAAETQSPVLITGETGTGKSLAARAIHEQSAASRPLVKVNCAAIPETLVEAELFGVERGAFTGAGASREGLFELADGGSLFLDEIGELDIGIQAKLLGVLDDGCVRRVGGSRDRRFEVRIIAATNVDVADAVADGRFRRDLFYRLNVIRIDLPPLRERIADLGDLVEVLLGALPRGRGAALAPGEIDRLSRYRWPGNVRELRNLLERSLLIDPSSALLPSRLLPNAGETPDRAALPPASPESLETLETVQTVHIERVLQACDGNRTRAAKVLGIGLATLRRRLNRPPAGTETV